MARCLKMFGSGHNMEGQLGRGTGKKIARKFERISVSEGVVAVAVATGYEHSLFLDDKGTVWSTGAASFFQTAHISPTFEFTQMRDQLPPYVKIAAGKLHSLLLDAEGRVSSVGSNRQGQLGFNSNESTSVLGYVEALGSERISDIFCGWLQSFAVTGDGSMSDSQKPIPIMQDQQVEKVASGISHTVALTKEGKLFVWGSNKTGQLGFHSSTQFVPSPTELKLNLEDGDRVIDIDTGWAHTAALTQRGNVYLWGDNRLGQLGLGEQFWFEPTRNTYLKDITNIACGPQFTFFIDKYNVVRATGSGTEHQLGIGEPGVFYEPVELEPFGMGTEMKNLKAFAGGTHTIITSEE